MVYSDLVEKFKAELMNTYADLCHSCDKIEVIKAQREAVDWFLKEHFIKKVN